MKADDPACEEWLTARVELHCIVYAVQVRVLVRRSPRDRMQRDDAS